jgi:phosphoserine phosphatase
MSGFHLVVQAPEVATGDLKALARLCAGTAIARVSDEAFRIDGADPGAREAVAGHCEAAGLDWGFVPDGRWLGDFGLLAIDMDSTLITIECIDEIADFAGRKADVAAVTAAAMRGEIDWGESLRRRVGALAGLPEDVLARVYRERLALTPGAERLIAAARRSGLATLLVSGGFTYFTDRLRERLGFDEAHANALDVEGGRLTGGVRGALVDAAAKAAHVARLRAARGLSREQVIAIGDGANDLAMMAEAGTSIAFRAKPVVRRLASYALGHVGLEGVLALFPDQPPGALGRGK